MGARDPTPAGGIGGWGEVPLPRIPWFRRTRAGTELPAVGLRLPGRPGPGPGLGGAVLAGVLRGPFTLLDVSELTHRQIQQDVGPAVGLLGGTSAVGVVTTVRLRDGALPPRWRHAVDALNSRLGRQRLDVLHLDAGGRSAAAGSAGDGGALAAQLARARADGVIGSVAVSGARGTVGTCLHLGAVDLLLDRGDGLLGDDQPALVELACRAGLGVVRAPLRRHRPGRPAGPGTARSRRVRLQEVCREFGVDVRTALVQSHLRDLTTTTTVLPVADEPAVRALARAAGAWLPEQFWARLAGTTAADAGRAGREGVHR